MRDISLRAEYVSDEGCANCAAAVVRKAIEDYRNAFKGAYKIQKKLKKEEENLTSIFKKIKDALNKAATQNFVDDYILGLIEKQMDKNLATLAEERKLKSEELTALYATMNDAFFFNPDAYTNWVGRIKKCDRSIAKLKEKSHVYRGTMIDIRNFFLNGSGDMFCVGRAEVIFEKAVYLCYDECGLPRPEGVI